MTSPYLNRPLRSLEEAKASSQPESAAMGVSHGKANVGGSHANRAGKARPSSSDPFRDYLNALNERQRHG